MQSQRKIFYSLPDRFSRDQAVIGGVSLVSECDEGALNNLLGWGV
jgi:hypothetical protein